MSGDKDLLRVNQFGNARIVNVAEFLGLYLYPPSSLAAR